jgi:hypothetical protein
MSRQSKYRIKGFILLLVFSINTLAGFACSIGMNMGYNEDHHQHSKEPVKASTEHHHNHHDEVPQKSEKKEQHHKGGEDCCGDITKLNLADKSVVSSISLQAPIFLIAFVSQFLLPEVATPSLLDNTTSYSLRRSWGFHDHTDLRIVIQSFQI